MKKRIRFNETRESKESRLKWFVDQRRDLSLSAGKEILRMRVWIPNSLATFHFFTLILSGLNLKTKTVKV